MEIPTISMLRGFYVQLTTIMEKTNVLKGTENLQQRFNSEDFVIYWTFAKIIRWKERTFMTGKPMEVLNEVQELNNLQEGRECELSNETSLQIHESLCELQRSLLSYLINLTDQGRKKSQAASPYQEQEIERWRSLNWECPGQEEYQHVTGILKRQKELLQQEYNQGKDTSLNKLLLDLLRSLWEYLLFNSTTRGTPRPKFTSLCQELRKFRLENAILERGAFKQHIRMLLYYLKESAAGWRTEDLTVIRCKEGINLAEFASPAL